MSATTPPSFIDDGISSTKSLPHGLYPAHIASWANATDSVSIYTGSFIDDGADMLLPVRHAPGFGQIDSRFYKLRKRKEDKDGVWNEHVQRAVSGDVQRHLEKLIGLGELEVKRESARREKRDTITVPVPQNWGSFVIKAEDGRVIVVDRDGEFDSGPQKAVSEQAGRCVEGLSAIEPLSPTEVSNRHDSTHSSREHPEDHPKDSSRRHSHSHKHKKSRRKHVSSNLSEALTPIPESAYESGYLASGGEEVLSPTGFFMTGGASGWPSRAATSVASSALAASKTYNYSVPGSPVASGSKSPIRSPPGGWPSPAPSLVKSVAPLEQQWGGGGADDVWKKDKSQQSEKSRRSHKSGRSHRSRREENHGFDNMSTKSHSTYKSLTVEDAPDTSLPEKKGNAATGWGGSGKGSDNGCKQSKKGSKGGWFGGEQGSKKSSKAASQNGWGGSKTSKKSWKGSATIEDNNGWAGGPSPGDDNWNASDKQSETSWDGFEKIKTLSEVSVAGSGSDRSSLHSPSPSRHSAKPSTHHSSRHGSQNGWGGNHQSWGN